jgi:hypothetical protein
MRFGPQAGAVSLTVPVQVSVAVPLAPSVVTGLPPWLQTVDVVGPPGNGTWLVTARLTTVLFGSRFVTENVHWNALRGGTGSEGQVFDIERPVVFWHRKILTEFEELPEIGVLLAVSVPVAAILSL